MWRSQAFWFDGAAEEIGSIPLESVQTSTVTSDIQLQFSLLSTSLTDSILEWNILGGVSSVDTSINISFNLLNTAQGVSTTSWNVLTSSQSLCSPSYNTLNSVSENKSVNFDDCPFRLTISEQYGNATLNLVYKFPKVVKSERFDIETGKVDKVFGYKKYQNI